MSELTPELYQDQQAEVEFGSSVNSCEMINNPHRPVYRTYSPLSRVRNMVLFVQSRTDVEVVLTEMCVGLNNDQYMWQLKRQTHRTGDGSAGSEGGKTQRTGV